MSTQKTWVEELVSNPAVQDYMSPKKNGRWNPLQQWMRKREIDSALSKAITSYNQEREQESAAHQAAMVSTPLRAFGAGYSYSGISEKQGYSFNKLRYWGDVCSPCSAIINRRIQHVTAFSEPVIRTMGFVEKPGFLIRLTDRDAEATDQDVKAVASLQQFIMELGTAPPPLEERPESYVPSFFHFLSQWTRDSLTMDWTAVRFWKPASDGNQVMSRFRSPIAAFSCVDAALIRPVSRIAEGVKNGVPVIREYESERPSVKGKDIRFVRIQNDASLRAEEQYREDELVAYARNTRTDERLHGMGIGELEQSFSAIEGWLFGLDYNLGRFRKDSLPRGFLQLVGKVNDQQLQSFRLEWMQLMMGNSKRWTIPMIAGEELDAKWTAIDLSSRDMEYHQLMFLLAVILHANFGIHPEETGYEALTTLRPPLSESSPEATLRYSQDSGLTPLLKHIESFINTNIVWKIYPDRRYTFEFVGLGESVRSDQIENWAAELEAGLNFPINIYRQRDIPITDQMKDHPALYLPMPLPKGMEYVDNLQQQAMQAQMEQQQMQASQMQAVQQSRQAAAGQGAMQAQGDQQAMMPGPGQGRIAKSIRTEGKKIVIISRNRQ